MSFFLFKGNINYLTNNKIGDNMYEYINGKIVAIENDYIVIDNSSIGYQICITNTKDYKINDSVTIYIYNLIKEEINILLGFKTLENKKLYIRLIKIKGVGPKIAFYISSTCDINKFYEHIKLNDKSYIMSFQKVGEKLATTILNSLSKQNNILTNNNYELQNALISLGISKKDIIEILPHVNTNISLDDQIKESLRKLAK